MAPTKTAPRISISAKPMEPYWPLSPRQRRGVEGSDAAALPEPAQGGQHSVLQYEATFTLSDPNTADLLTWTEDAFVLPTILLCLVW